MLLELGALHLRVRTGRPSGSPPGSGCVLAGELGALVGHLEEEQEGELLQVVLVAEAVVAEDVAVAPELLDEAV